MKGGIAAIETLPWPTRVAVEDLETQVQGWTRQQHNADGSHGPVSAASMLFGGPWAILASAILTPAQLTADANDYAPGGIDTAIILRLSTNASRTVTGMQAPMTTDVAIKILMNVGAQDLVLAHANTGSKVGNRFDNPGAASLTLNAGDRVFVIYEPTLAKWCPIGL